MEESEMYWRDFDRIKELDANFEAVEVDNYSVVISSFYSVGKKLRFRNENEVTDIL